MLILRLPDGKENSCLGSDTLFYIPRPVSLAVTASTVRVRVINVDGAADDAGVYVAVFR